MLSTKSRKSLKHSTAQRSKNLRLRTHTRQLPFRLTTLSRMPKALLLASLAHTNLHTT